MNESDRRWQENVLRNAALTSSVHSVTKPGLHTLKIWMVDPGIVLDAIEAETGGAQTHGICLAGGNPRQQLKMKKIIIGTKLAALAADAAIATSAGQIVCPRPLLI